MPSDSEVTLNIKENVDNNHHGVTTTNEILLKIEELSQLVINLSTNVAQNTTEIKKSGSGIDVVRELLNKNHEELKISLNQVEKKADEALALANNNENLINDLIANQDNLKDSILEELKPHIENSIAKETEPLKKEIEELKTEQEDLRNRSMRSTLIFRNIKEEADDDDWEKLAQKLVKIFSNLMNYEEHQIDNQISRAHRTPKSLGNDARSCRPIFVQFVNWRYAEEIRRRIIHMHSKSKTRITVAQMYSSSLTTRRNDALTHRRDVLKDSPNLTIFLVYPATLMYKEKGSNSIPRTLKRF